GEQVVILDMRGFSSLADFFIISQGRSTKHVQGIANKLRKNLRKKGTKCRGVEGEKEGKWILMDYGDVIVHLFYEPIRDFYDLEGLWSEVPKIIL
ncbi:MAG: ribosome silencing factor, partial [Deltaproteobacteria bacterium]|nr:ribosome silencing factor [Deltaproteobacteria bacterium]